MAESENPEPYLSEDGSPVLKHRKDPPEYAILLRFPGMSEIVNELGMPKDRDVIFNLSYVSVEDFLYHVGYSYLANIRRHQSYTVELFGMLVKLPEVFYPGVKIPLPDPSQYKCQPRYWWVDGNRPVQIWRLRVLTCPLEDIETSELSPFGKFPPGTLYVEERWHPLADMKKIFIGGLEQASKQRGIGLHRLHKDALRILEGNFEPSRGDVKIGRTRGSTYYTPGEFARALGREYKRLYEQNKQKPGRKAVAAALKISVSTLYRYCKNPGVPWPSGE